LYFFEAGNDLIPPANIATLKALIEKHLDSAEEGGIDNSTLKIAVFLHICA
jgi:hypothetical protein